MGLADHAVDQTAIYQRFFHGPAFQVLDDTTGVTTDALSANGHVRHLSIAGGLLTSPLVLEAAFQAAGLHRMMVYGAFLTSIDCAWFANPASGMMNRFIWLFVEMGTATMSTSLEKKVGCWLCVDLPWWKPGRCRQVEHLILLKAVGVLRSLPV